MNIKKKFSLNYVRLGARGRGFGILYHHVTVSVLVHEICVIYARFLNALALLDPSAYAHRVRFSLRWDQLIRHLRLQIGDQTCPLQKAKLSVTLCLMRGVK
jgi:hypothetical protein